MQLKIESHSSQITLGITTLDVAEGFHLDYYLEFFIQARKEIEFTLKYCLRNDQFDDMIYFLEAVSLGKHEIDNLAVDWPENYIDIVFYYDRSLVEFHLYFKEYCDYICLRFNLDEINYLITFLSLVRGDITLEDERVKSLLNLHRLGDNL